VVPTFVAFLFLGDVWVAALYQTGEFGADDTRLVYLTLAGYALGLVASTSTRLFSSAFFALRDTRTPARIAAIRVATSALLGFILMTQFEPVRVFGITFGPGLGEELRIGTRSLGAVGLALGAGVGAWLEWALLRRELNRRIGAVGAGAGVLGRMLIAALAGAAAGWGARMMLGGLHPVIDAAIIGGAFGAVYLGLGVALGIEQAGAVAKRLARLAERGR
jgi:putative peptidoglycan lipid II flippase